VIEISISWIFIVFVVGWFGGYFIGVFFGGRP